MSHTLLSDDELERVSDRVADRVHARITRRRRRTIGAIATGGVLLASAIGTTAAIGLGPADVTESVYTKAEYVQPFSTCMTHKGFPPTAPQPTDAGATVTFSLYTDQNRAFADAVDACRASVSAKVGESIVP